MQSNVEVTRAAAKMAEMLSNELGVVVTEERVRAIIKDKWHRLSILAHAVHDEVRGSQRQY